MVAGDGIKRELDGGKPRLIGSWLGPTKRSRAMLYATITNIVAYLPLLLLTGNVGLFLYSMPVVLTCSLIAALARLQDAHPAAELLPPAAEPETSRAARGAPHTSGSPAGITGWAAGPSGTAGGSAVASLAFLALGGWIMSQLKPQFFPKDLQYLSYAEVWLPEDAPLSATRAVTNRVEGLIQQHAHEYFEHHGGHEGPSGAGLAYTFIGGGGPRFWFSFSPEPRQTNYGLIVIQGRSKWDTPGLTQALQDRSRARCPAPGWTCASSRWARRSGYPSPSG